MVLRMFSETSIKSSLQPASPVYESHSEFAYFWLHAVYPLTIHLFCYTLSYTHGSYPSRLSTGDHPRSQDTIFSFVLAGVREIRVGYKLRDPEAERRQEQSAEEKRRRKFRGRKNWKGPRGQAVLPLSSLLDVNSSHLFLQSSDF